MKKINSSRSTKVDEKSNAVISKASGSFKCRDAMAEKCSGVGGNDSYPEASTSFPKSVTRRS